MQNQRELSYTISKGVSHEDCVLNGELGDHDTEPKMVRRSALIKGTSHLYRQHWSVVALHLVGNTWY